MFDWTRAYDPQRVGVAKNAEREPARPAFIIGDTVISYGQLDLEINALANALLNLGMKPGDNIAAPRAAVRTMTIQ